MRTETRRAGAGTRGQRTTRVCTVNRSRTAAILVSSNQVHFVFQIRIRNYLDTLDPDGSVEIAENVDVYLIPKNSFAPA
jgi:hypothetical protein